MNKENISIPHTNVILKEKLLLGKQRELNSESANNNDHVHARKRIALLDRQVLIPISEETPGNQITLFSGPKSSSLLATDSFVPEVDDNIRDSMTVIAEKESECHTEEDHFGDLLKELLEDTTRHNELMEQSKQIHLLSLQLEKDVESDASNLVSKLSTSQDPAGEPLEYPTSSHYELQDLPTYFVDDYSNLLLY